MLKIQGPSAIGDACAGSGSSVTFDASGTPPSAGRAISTWQWSSPNADLQSLLASQANRSSVTLSAAAAQDLAAGNYTLQLNATNWLGAVGKHQLKACVDVCCAGSLRCHKPGPSHQHSEHMVAGSATFTFTKDAAQLPLISIVGGGRQTFLLALGKTVQTSIDLSSVCQGENGVCMHWCIGAALADTSSACMPCAASLRLHNPEHCPLVHLGAGKRVTYLWRETSGLLPGFNTTTPTLQLAVS